MHIIDIAQLIWARETTSSVIL